ncbi:T6SS phospholipase effector Tle1-like catalytic domain-containing protein [Halomonas elongata]|uniref:DUF2235 domain-containing protein n=1 Tax=Halomonas elongata (strain ATCC 33173 / DSM 2581 / NBRC 15536 / NCIMB 2198 / 1H9) TaxID=768066 RepID=E1VA72_HALED|nr:DUF2235 domain-containing protein [Halomonas elongata]WBF17705.1 DUF2235 domain-containing protein [Halomonas elongata]WPU46546.1 DUF2235 domain-containing protein [Halomonas elongata DSM 2581]CBV43960.1 DUF2235 family protein [Halomonas elongata DSM 2581]
MVDSQTLERCQAINARSEGQSSSLIGVDCQLTIEIGIFFDGIGRHLEQDLRDGRVSNIGRLYSAFPDQEKDRLGQAFRRLYLPGLGAPYEENVQENFEATLRRASSEAVDGVEGHLRGGVTGAAKEAVFNTDGGAWWEVFGRSWKASLTKPWEWVKSARDAAIRTGAEVFSPIRDHPITANLLMSGAATRQSAAIEQFQGAVSDVAGNSQMPLGTIRVSVFGFDFGAALAKAFVRELLEEVCEQEGEHYRYEDAEVQIVFAGLFDCVDRTHPELGPVDWFHPLTPVLDDGGPLHPGCRRALHLIAAHERRFYRRCRPLGTLQADWREILQPGISEDIGGGLKPDEQKVSAELSLAALHRMYRSAMMAGVSFPSLEELQAQDVATSRLFELNDQVDGHSLIALQRHYERLVNDALSPDEAHFRQHAQLYLAWLAHRYREYRATRAALEAQLDTLPDRTPSGVLGVPSASLTTPHDEWQQIEADAAEVEQALGQLETQWGWLEEVDQEARQIRALFLSSDGMTRRQARQTLEYEYRMAEAWWRWTRETAPPELPEEVERLFAYGLHDKRPAEQRMRNRQATMLLGGYHFFAWRRLDMPE